MRKIFLVYAGDPHNQEKHAPYSITRNLYQFLSSKTTVAYADWCAGGPLTIGPDDVFVGHPNYAGHTATRWAFAHAKCHAKFLIHPLHTNIVADNWPFDDLVQQCDGSFGIMGPYWYDSLDSSIFSGWKKKITRVDLAVDGNHYPYLKHEFNPVGKRALLYVGSSIPNKNLGYMAQIMSKMPDVTLFWYGADDHHLSKLNNVQAIGWTDLNRSVATNICKKCDFFLSTSTSDANPSTATETTAWGLIPICSKESGYYEGATCHNIFTNISIENVDNAVSTIRKMLNTDSATLKQRSLTSRKAVEEHYNWDKFCNTIWDVLSQYCE